MSLSSNKVVSTRVGLDPRNPDQRQFVIDWEIPSVTSDDEPPVEYHSCSTNATISLAPQVYRNRAAKTWRVILTMQPKAGNKDPVDLRCTLKDANGMVSETWTYLWTPP
jgi:glucans biosynthesis protein